MLDALRVVGGEEAVKRVEFDEGKEGEVVRRIVASWPSRFDNGYALGLGFEVDEGGMEGVVRAFKRDVDEGRA